MHFFKSEAQEPFQVKMIAAIVISLACCMVSHGADASSSMKQTPSGNSTLTVTSNAPSTVIAIDGIVAGNAGERLEAAKSTVVVAISAPGFVAREFEVSLNPRVRNFFQINLAEESKLPSNKTTVPVGADTAKWRRKSANWLKCVPQSTDTDCQVIAIMRKSLEQQAAVSLLYQREITRSGPDGLATAEQQNEQALFKGYYLNPLEGSAYEQLARFELYKQWNCFTVNEIIKSAQMHHLISEQLALLQGVCFELVEGQEAAAKYYAKALVSFKSSMDLYWRWFHQGGSGWDLEFSTEKKKKCAAMFPTFLPCFLDEIGAKADDVVLSKRVSARFTKSRQLKPLIDQIMTEVHAKKIDNAIKLARQSFLPNRFVMEVLALSLTEATVNDNELLESHFVPLIRRSFPVDLKNMERILIAAESHFSPVVLIEFYRRLLEFKHDDPKLAFKAGKLALNLGKYEDAYSLLQNIPDSFQPGHDLRAQVLVKLNRFEEAKKEYQWLADKNAKSWQALYNLAVIHEKQGHYREFVTLVEQILKMQPPPPDNVAKKLSESAEYYQKKLKKKPFNAP